MYMKVKTESDAWELVNRFFPGSYKYDKGSQSRAGYPIYRSTVPESNAYICDLGDRLELNYDDGHSENIWIEEEMGKDTVVVVGMRREQAFFGVFTIRDVKEIFYHHAERLVHKFLDDGRPGIEITLADGRIASFGDENVAYVRFE